MRLEELPRHERIVLFTITSGEGTDYQTRNNLALIAYQSACFPCWRGNNINSFTGYSNTSAFSDDKNNVEVIIIPPNYYPTGSTVRLLISADGLVADGINPDNPGQPFRQDFAVFADNLY